MLKIYLSTVVIWAIALYGLLKVFSDQMVKNGWIDKYGEGVEGQPAQRKTGWRTKIILLSAVPVMRLAVFIVMFLMAIYTPEQYEEWRSKHEENKGNH